MNKCLIFPVDTVINPITNKPYDNGIIELINSLNEQGDKVWILSRRQNKLDLANKFLKDTVKYHSRESLKEIIKKNKDKYLSKFLIVVSVREVDMQFSANNKLLFINPMWVEDKQEKALKYGLPIKTPKGLKKVIDIIKNQQTWFYSLEVDDTTKVLSLTSANSYGGKHSKEEKEIVEGFRDYLKKGNRRYSRVLLFHFLAGIANNPEFKDIKDWAIFPSSGTELNEDMFQFKEKARYLKNGKKKEPIFIRHTRTFKSHEDRSGEKRLPCDRHFDTIVLNPKYKGTLKGRVVCVLDDYLTNGTSFETARNLLLKEKVEKIFFVSLGRYYKTRDEVHYLKQDYILKGDLYTEKGYSYEKSSYEWLCGDFNYKAIEEIEELYNIIYT